MSIFLLPAHARSSWRYLLHLKHSPALRFASDQFNAPSHLPPTPPSFFCSKPSHLGTRLLHTQQCPSLVQDSFVVPPLDANRPVAPLGFSYRHAPLYIRLAIASASPRLISYEFVAARRFSGSEAVNLVIASTEEGSQEVLEAASFEPSTVPADEDGSCSPAVEEVAQTLIGYDEGPQSESNVAECQKLEEILQTSAELQFECPTGPNQSSVVQMKDTEDFGLSVNRLEKMIEVQMHSFDQVRAQLENQKEIVSSILKDVTFLKSQCEKSLKEEVTLTSLSTNEDRVEKKKSGESGSNVITNDERVSLRADVSGKFQPPFWPEWTSFLERLKRLKFFQPDSQRLPEGCDIFEDPAQIRRAFYMFSRSYGPNFELLSRNDLQVLVQYGCQSVDKRNIASEQRLRNYFKEEVSSTSNESSSEQSNIVTPNLSDVMRLIFSMAEHAFSDKAALPEEVKSSVIHLLQELSRLNVDKDDTNVRSETAVHSSAQVKKKGSNSGSVVDSKENDQQKQLRGAKLEKDKKQESTKIAGKIETNTRAGANTSLSKEWKCPRCSFMNIQHKNRCVECSLKRPQKADSKSNLDQDANEKGSAMSFLDEDLNLEKASSTSDSKSNFDKKNEKGSAMSFLDDDLKIENPSIASNSKGHIDEKRVRRKKENTEQVIASSRQSTQEEDSTDGNVSSLLSEDGNIHDSDEDSDSSDASDDFDILDDISESEDAADIKKSAVRRSSLSDLVDGDMNDFTRKSRDQGGVPCRNDFERSKDRRLRGKRYGDEQSSKAKRASKEDTDDEDLSDDEESPRRSGRSYSRGRDTHRYGARGGRGFRGESHYDSSSKRNDRGSGSSRSYDRSYSGDRDREYRWSRDGGRGFGRGRGRGRGSFR